ncbi:DUF881 domain-containing protein [Bacillus salitolerans]|uniref:DUF881 domain-containing protein n=1 Tax=Bacillus salitolerans TaxID=1437434 RepID=A0ABW4LLX8_9BACI
MGSKNIYIFTSIAVLIGFMLAIQFSTTKEPFVRDTRDAWELREAIKKELEVQTELIKEIRKYEQALTKYESERQQSKELALKETLQELKEEAGLTDVSGEGIIITIKDIFEEPMLGQVSPTVSAELLRRLINELNINGADEISIHGQRITNTTPIREVNRFTTVNNVRLPSVPIEVRVISKNAEKLYNRMIVSESIEFEFELERLKLDISAPTSQVTIPAYDETIRIKFMEPVKSEKGGS